MEITSSIPLPLGVMLAILFFLFPHLTLLTPKPYMLPPFVYFLPYLSVFLSPKRYYLFAKKKKKIVWGGSFPLLLGTTLIECVRNKLMVYCCVWVNTKKQQHVYFLFMFIDLKCGQCLFWLHAGFVLVFHRPSLKTDNCFVCIQ